MPLEKLTGTPLVMTFHVLSYHVHRPHHVNWAPRHDHGMSCVQISDGWDSPQIQRVVVSMLSKSELMLYMAFSCLFPMDVIAMVQAVHVINFCIRVVLSVSVHCYLYSRCPYGGYVASNCRVINN